MTQDEIRGQIYSAIEKSGDALKSALTDSEAKSVVVVPVVVVVSNCVINK
jgi:hypothetical protein